MQTRIVNSDLPNGKYEVEATEQETHWKHLNSLVQIPTTTLVSGGSAGSLKLAFSLSSSNSSTRFWSLATNSIRSDENVAKDKELALSYTFDSCSLTMVSPVNERRGHDIGFLSILSEDIHCGMVGGLRLGFWISHVSLRELITTPLFSFSLTSMKCWGSSNSLARLTLPQLSELTRRYDFRSIFFCNSSAASCTSSSMSLGLNFSIFSILLPSSRNTLAPSVPTLCSSLLKTFLFSSGAYRYKVKTADYVNG